MVAFSLSNVFETVATVIPAREFIVQGDRRVTYAETNHRVSGFARFLVGRGIGLRTARSTLARHQSGQDHVGVYLRNRTEYPEILIGAYRARAVPFNINYRYVEQELAYLLRDARTRVLVYQAEFAPRVAAVLPDLPEPVLLIQVADDSGHDLLPGAVDYEQAVATAPPGALPEPDGEDLYLLYTGGTTGMPKGVLWRQDDIYRAAMGGTRFGTGEQLDSYAEVADSANATGGAYRLVVAAPFMHGAAQWLLFQAVTNGGTLVLPTVADRFDAAAILDAVSKERVVALPVVGDAMARPIATELERRDYDLSALAAIHNAGAPLTPAVRQRLIAAFDRPILVVDSVGSSESGIQMTQIFDAAASVRPGSFVPADPHTAVIDEELGKIVDEPGSVGWLGRSGRIPLGYLGDEEKTARTFPVVDGTRWSIAGDRARILDDGRIELLGRDNLTINSGGEKIFVEEVERALAAHAAVLDVVVVGRPSQRWGSEVVAIVHVDDDRVTDADLLAECAEHIAGYKLPKTILRCPAILRSPTGKADYRWAREFVTRT
ncbi:acyl-CoA synthetase [Nocardia halotolerans]|uniref:Acyl-CoA synthetase n=1 Tax=Nocardia halotolerans TaxID=1755878 RepID=A0ABV8VAM0_9NOCA